MTKALSFAAFALCASLVSPSPGAADAKSEAKDAWITTKAKVKPLTAADVSATAVNAREERVQG